METTETKTTTEATVDERKTPLWQTTLRAMRDAGITFGKKFEVSWLSNQLNAQPETIQFGVGVAAINDELGREGYYLTARDQMGQFYVVATPEQAEHISDSKGYKAVRELRRQRELYRGLLDNPSAALNAEQRKRIEGKEERTAIRMILLRRCGQFQQLAKKHSAKLLEA